MNWFDWSHILASCLSTYRGVEMCSNSMYFSGRIHIQVFVYSCFCFELVFKIFLVLFLSYLLFKSMFFNLTASLVSYLSVCRILLVEVYCPPYVTCGSRKTSWDGPVNKKYLFNSGQHASILLHKSEFEYCWSLQL